MCLFNPAEPHVRVNRTQDLKFYPHADSLILSCCLTLRSILMLILCSDLQERACNPHISGSDFSGDVDKDELLLFGTPPDEQVEGTPPTCCAPAGSPTCCFQRAIQDSLHPMKKTLHPMKKTVHPMKRTREIKLRPCCRYLRAAGICVLLVFPCCWYLCAVGIPCY